MLGKLEEQVDKERREALAAKLKYSQAVKDLEDVKYQIAKLSSERLNYVNCQQEYDLLYAEKKEQLMFFASRSLLPIARTCAPKLVLLNNR